jgi:excisionase family DNA binding protein
MKATAAPPQEGQGFVTAKPIAKFYSVTEQTIYTWAHRKKIPCTRFQGTVRFNFEAVRAVIEGRAL